MRLRDCSPQLFKQFAVSNRSRVLSRTFLIWTAFRRSVSMVNMVLCVQPGDRCGAKKYRTLVVTTVFLDLSACRDDGK